MTQDATQPEPAEAIFARAAQRAQQMNLPYAGAVTPAEAYDLARTSAAKIVDVRTELEFNQVGHVSGTPLVVWPREGGQAPLQAFVEGVAAQFDPEEPLLFLCRSGGRSHSAATVMTQVGYSQAYNILEGFEGGQPGQGWRNAGLPWTTKG